MALNFHIDRNEQNSYDAIVIGSDISYFKMMKKLTVFGYFSSQPGATEALRYVPILGRYDGCIPYHEREKAWA